MEDLKIKRVCGFNVSSIHFSMMILPYIGKELEKNNNIVTFLESNLEKTIPQVLSKILLKKELKEKILNINWKAWDIEEKNINNILEKNLLPENNLSIIVYGQEKYINNVNDEINKVIKNKNINHLKILNCYIINDFKENIQEILSSYDTMFNTSGEHKIKDIYYSA